jgi:steroid delta-isomerase-like uncharacterized protein
MSQQNKALVRRAVEEVWNRGNFAIVGELVASDLLIHSSTPGDDIQGPEGVKQFYTTLRAAFPDIHFTIEDQIAEGDRVVTRWTARATHKGEYQGVPPTGKQFSLDSRVSSTTKASSVPGPRGNLSKGASHDHQHHRHRRT